MSQLHVKPVSPVPRPWLALSMLVWAGLFAGQAVAAGPYRSGEVLVKLRDEASPAAVQRALGQRGDRGRVAPGVEQVRLRPGESVEEAMAELRARPGVEHVQPNYIKRVQRVPDDPDFKRQWGLRNTGQVVPGAFGARGAEGADIDATEAWDESTGDRSVVVAVIDTGVDYTHPDLAGNLWSNPGEVAGNGRDDDGNGYVDDVLGWDFVTDDGRPVDMNGHGTYVAGALGARGDNHTAVAGVAWVVSLMVIRAFDENGVGDTQSIVRAIDYAVENGAQVINASYGAPGGTAHGTSNFDGFEYEAVQRARDAGVLVVASACNDGSNNDGLRGCVPASYGLSNIISVAATDAFDELWTASNYGATSVDLGAPGVGVVTVSPTFEEVWSDTLFSDRASTGIDLTGQQHCRAAVQYDGLSLNGNDSVAVDARVAGGEWEPLGELSLRGANFFGLREVYVDISDFDGEADVEFRARLIQGQVEIPGTRIGGLEVICYGAPDSGTYYYADGTSMAAPFVSGAAALMLAKNGALGVSDLRGHLLDTVDPASDLPGLVATGGRLNVAAALAAVDATGATTQGQSSENAATPDNSGGGGGGRLGLPSLALLALAALGRAIGVPRRAAAAPARA